MKVILTHNNADCDAIASLLAMHKLEPDAIPVLPPRLNRNIARFLHLYDRAWQFIRPEDVPRGKKVELALVVDTQRFNMTRGMNAHTPVYIVDHHTAAHDLPAHHTYTGEPTGANVTLLVEKLADQGIRIDGLEATLMLLGLYEDTGSLSFKSTTPRDLQAGSWLLEQGADLDIVRQFLQHIMTPAQRELLQQLQTAAIMLDVKGHNVAITSATLQESVMEVALIASELVNLFGCDALIIALQEGEHVQLVARSTIDEIDLGNLLRHFNGSGHLRAAAGLARMNTLEVILPQLYDLLPQYTQPAICVEALMSKGVQTLASQLTVAQAQAIMNESGHEGYPVIDAEGNLVGLVTQRAVDRAMLHDLHRLSVHDVMEAGTHHVTPADPIDLLKERMLDTRWGQMPVLNQQGQLIGIVTRTDLIKHWGNRPADQTQERMQAFHRLLPDAVWELLETISTTAENLNKAVFLVGGIVRDLLLKRPNLDIDLVVEGDAIKLARRLQNQYGGDLHTHQQFGTATWTLTPAMADKLPLNLADLPPTIDFATSRAEFYDAPTALPTVRRGSIKLDLHRRDFSINALAIRLAPRPMGHLLDFYNGERDLRDGVVRVLHSLSFIDDPTRMLRAVRFEQRFGFHLDPRTESLFPSALPLLERVSGERLRHELELLLAEDAPLSNLERLADLGVLLAIHPRLELTDSARTLFRQFYTIQPNPPWELATPWDSFAFGMAVLTYRLSAEELQAIIQRLTIPRAAANHLYAAQLGYQNLAQLVTLKPSGVVQLAEKWGQVGWLLAWLQADHATQQILEKLVTQWRFIQPQLRGNDLIRMGLPSGPLVGQLLGQLRAAWLDGIVETETDERDLAERFIRHVHP